VQLKAQAEHHLLLQRGARLVLSLPVKLEHHQPLPVKLEHHQPLPVKLEHHQPLPVKLERHRLLEQDLDHFPEQEQQPEAALQLELDLKQPLRFLYHCLSLSV
jgi:hypothetical protein